MNAGRRLPSVVVAALVTIFLFTGVALPNGINPSRPAGSYVTSCTCEEADGEEQQIFRLTLMYGKESRDSVVFRADGKAETIAASDIASLNLLSSKVNKNGFVKAELSMQGSVEKKREGLLQVKSGSKKILLRGFNEKRKRVSIELLRCRRIEFSSSSGEVIQNPDNRPKTAD